MPLTEEQQAADLARRKTQMIPYSTKGMEGNTFANSLMGPNQTRINGIVRMNPSLGKDNWNSLLENNQAGAKLRGDIAGWVSKGTQNKQHQLSMDIRNKNYGTPASHFASSIMNKTRYTTDENGNPVAREDTWATYNPEAANAISGGLQLAGDWMGGGALDGLGIPVLGGRTEQWRNEANAAAEAAGNQADIQNTEIRNRMMKNAGEQADAMNMQNGQITAGMTDNAIAQANAYESGMQGIDMSGIEGSANMERNLQYGQSRADAQEQLQYDMMNKGAQGLEDGLAQSFSDLSQNKAQAMQGAWSGSIGANNAALTNDYIANGEFQRANSTSLNDIQEAVKQAEGIADANPNVEEETNTVAPAAQAQQAQTPAAQGGLDNLGLDQLIAIRDKAKGGSSAALGDVNRQTEAGSLAAVQNRINELLKNSKRY